METKTKALFLDLDGTLLNDQKEITPGNRSAIEKALAAGHRVVITTGRPLVSAIEQARRLDLTGLGCYLITFNGGIIYDLGAKKVIFEKNVPLELVQAVFEEANRRGLHIQTYDERQVLVEPRCDDEAVRRYCSIILMTYSVVPSVAALTREPAKLLLIDFQNKAPLEDFQAWVLERYGDKLDSFFSCEQYLEVIPRGMSKGNALLQLAGLLGIPQKNTVAAGDAANDLSMIEAAGVGVAMCNGTEEVKAAADTITTRDNNHDGIAEVIEKYLFDSSEM
ncbi:MAG TPA: Cof-type HAD-IIB family hydrolase [Candidatus Flavonifractor merdigallinarum]|uniref:Cof-type HAD-IIB family hydrolase n=1 Tax=Candidatus Flavonifractor merdigallinarum TaxID=2838589 RepID=A0A9D1Y9M1_9FIRM|nr:Cof-type HAD-IIB family hydrolase [Candidatus Flavonifractor merdigallinarum]